jgi:hypothetical protein
LLHPGILEQLVEPVGDAPHGFDAWLAQLLEELPICHVGSHTPIEGIEGRRPRAVRQ